MRKQPDKNSSFTPCADIKICGILISIYYLYACVRSRAGSRQEICPAADGKTEKIGEFLHDGRIAAKNARLPVEDIAAMMGKTPAQVATMMDEAVAKGYIRGFEAMIDWEQAGINVVEAVIELHVSPRKSRGFDEIASVIASFDEVDSVLLMSGSYDLQVVIKGHSFQEIALFVAKRLSPLDDVLSTATSFVLRPYKRGGKLYLNEEADERECTVL